MTHWIPYPSNKPSLPWFYWIRIKGVKTNKGITVGCWDDKEEGWCTPDGAYIDQGIDYYKEIDLESIMPTSPD